LQNKLLKIVTFKKSRAKALSKLKLNQKEKA